MKIPQSAWEQHHYRFGLAGEGQADIIQKHLASHGGTILDIGCGLQGRHVVNLARLCDLVIAADKEAGMVRSARADGAPANSLFAVANVKDLPFRAQVFNVIVALGLLAYISDPGPALSELDRVVRPGGLIMVTNAVVHPIQPLLEAAGKTGLRLMEQAEGYCPAASGAIKRRYLCIFEKS